MRRKQLEMYPIDMQAMGINLLAFAGHKGTYGPQGTGGLVVTPDLHLETWVEGGTGFPSRPETMPDELPIRLEAGTQNSAGIAGLLAGVQFVLEQGVEKIHAHEMTLAKRLIDQLQAIPGLRITRSGEPGAAYRGSLGHCGELHP